MSKFKHDLLLRLIKLWNLKNEYRGKKVCIEKILQDG